MNYNDDKTTNKAVVNCATIQDIASLTSSARLRAQPHSGLPALWLALCWSMEDA